MEAAAPPPLEGPSETLADAHEVIDGLFVGSADAAVEATTGPNSRQIGYILDVAGCVTPAIFSALASALADEALESSEASAVEEQPPPMTRRSWRSQVYLLNGVETLSVPLDDHGRTQLSED